MADNNDLKEKLVEERKALQESIRQWERLLQDETFQRYLDHLRSEVRSKRNADFSTLITSLDVAFQSAGWRAEIAATQHAITLVQSEIDDAKWQIENINTELEQWSSKPQQ